MACVESRTAHGEAMNTKVQIIVYLIVLLFMRESHYSDWRSAVAFIAISALVFTVVHFALIGLGQ